MSHALTVTVAIPTYNRGSALVQTLKQLFVLKRPALEILVIDQTHAHPKNIQLQLENMHQSGDIAWHRLDAPSIPRAMNKALMESHGDIVLFLDDDIVVTSELVAEHAAAHETSAANIVVGMIRQPWHKADVGGCDPEQGSGRPAGAPGYIDYAIACNMSVSRLRALDHGGFDENFVGAAYRFEDEFARRLNGTRNMIYYHPKASIDHLKLDEGGTRAHGNHLTTLSPVHSVGAYYFYLRAPKVRRRIWYIAKRPFRSVMTKHHLKKPWWIPITFTSEIAGIFWAFVLFSKGPRYLKP